MNIKHVAIATLSLLAGTAAMACPDHLTASDKSQNAGQYITSSRTRAEVIADLEIYRKSGLAALDTRDSPETYSAEYQAAQARYQTLRASPEFASLVSKIAKARGEMVTTASAGSSVVAQ